MECEVYELVFLLIGSQLTPGIDTTLNKLIKLVTLEVQMNGLRAD